MILSANSCKFPRTAMNYLGPFMQPKPFLWTCAFLIDPQAVVRIPMWQASSINVIHLQKTQVLVYEWSQLGTKNKFAHVPEYLLAGKSIFPFRPPAPDSGGCVCEWPPLTLLWLGRSCAVEQILQVEKNLDMCHGISLVTDHFGLQRYARPPRSIYRVRGINYNWTLACPCLK